MKKIIALLLVAVLAASSAFVLASCGESGDKAASDSKDELHMATNAFFEPYEYYEDGKVVGIDAEMAQAVADVLGKSLMIEEIADIVIYCIYLSDKLDINIADAVDDKIASNELKYPAELSRDNSKKYTELQS